MSNVMEKIYYLILNYIEIRFYTDEKYLINYCQINACNEHVKNLNLNIVNVFLYVSSIELEIVKYSHCWNLFQLKTFVWKTADNHLIFVL